MKINNKNLIITLHVVLMVLVPFSIYYFFRWNPIVFDDLYFFTGAERPQYLNTIFDFSIRWLPYATFEWTRVLLGDDVVWLHFGNLFIHILNGVFLYCFLNYIFSFFESENITALSARNTAFFATLIFMVHPAAVYSVNYISQRSMLMATFFAIAMLYSFVKGMNKKNNYILALSVFFYGMAVLSKEHAVMLPALVFCMAFLFLKSFKTVFKRFSLYFVVCFFIACYVFLQIKHINLYGNPYESGADELLGRLTAIDPGFDVKNAYFYSVFTQAGLFFKYLMLWIIPSPLLMSVDMYETFATKFFVFPQLIGFISFMIYPFLSIWLMKKDGLTSLLGFAILCPWLLFFTELSTVRIQESFVIYRSYIWMVFFSCALPFLIQKVVAKKSMVFLSLAVLILLPLTLQRLVSFSHPLLLWDDAARLVQGKENRPGVERVYHNRGLAYAHQKQYQLAIDDYNKALEIWPKYSFVYNDRAAAYLELKDYQQAMNDFNQAISLKPDYFRPYLGRAHIFELMGKPMHAKENYAIACSLGVTQACAKAE